MRYRNLSIYSLIFVSLFGSLNAGTIREKYEETFKFKPGGQLILTNTNGSIIIESWDKEQIRVEAEKTVKASNRRTAEQIMEKIEIEIKHEDNFLEIKTHLPRRRGGFWDSVFGEGVNMSVRYRLYVPRELKLDIGTVNGGVDVSEVSGKIRVRSTNGHVHIYEAGGSVNAKTTNGGIEVELLEFDDDEDMSFKTTNGGIKVYFPANFHAYIDARTTNGSIKTDFPIKVRGEISKRRLRGSINSGGGNIDLHTTNGGIKILER